MKQRRLVEQQLGQDKRLFFRQSSFQGWSLFVCRVSLKKQKSELNLAQGILAAYSVS